MIKKQGSKIKIHFSFSKNPRLIGTQNLRTQGKAPKTQGVLTPLHAITLRWPNIFFDNCLGTAGCGSEIRSLLLYVQ